jgi:hypothetical protein
MASIATFVDLLIFCYLTKPIQCGNLLRFAFIFKKLVDKTCSILAFLDSWSLLARVFYAIDGGFAPVVGFCIEDYLLVLSMMNRIMASGQPTSSAC